ncbi:DUF4307 domain-containing protein [Brachybacterium sp. MASK1Z-5]|uniref:DUF4307 domain-containing protein n=1 Tax=Brachybacterium halotolerans TaxID=2795215 RepID=A0ABS1BAG8_9MICO|nr:DUF4307 domain-containing protein [Brachybacterium halotolerans]MBK0331167.1 DUF4307 domain-containing protein [Brachybacterium halotolerans]
MDAHAPSTPTGSTDPLASRYGGPLVPRRTARVLFVIGAVVFLAVLAFVGYRFADQPVTAKDVGYDHVDDDTISLTFQLTRSPSVDATCTVQALNAGRAQVGFREVEIPGGPERQVVRTVDIDTQGEAVSAEVISCQKA